MSRLIPHRPRPSLPKVRPLNKLRGLVFALGLVIISIMYFSRPAAWVWLTGPEQAPPQAAGDKQQADASPAMIPDEPLPPGVFRMAPDAVAMPPEEGQQPPAVDGFDLRIPADALAAVKDEYIGLRAHDLPAYEEMLERARTVPFSVLERASEKNVTFVQLYNDPAHWRGRLVTVKGTLKALFKREETVAGKTFTVYEGWMQPEEGSHRNPIVMHCVEKPEGLSPGEGLNERITISGYFLRRFLYVAKHGGTATAPMLVGRRVRWFPVEAPVAKQSLPVQIVLTVVIVLGSALTFLLWRFSRSSGPREANLVSRVRAPDAQELATLGSIEVEDLGAAIRRMEAEAREAAPPEPPDESPST